MNTPPHISFLRNTETTLNTSDGKQVEVWELCHTSCSVILSAWAKHFREHYCLDTLIDRLSDGTGLSRREYLLQIKFPDEFGAPGPSTRAGDFGEILVADFLAFIDNYEIPSRKTRYCNKTNRNESTKGSDIIAFKFANSSNPTPQDELAVFEAKAKFSGNTNSAQKRLQDAIEDSAKDKLRIAESLNAMKQRFIDSGDIATEMKVKRFQSEADNPYKITNGAVALVCNSNYSSAIATDADARTHPNSGNLRLIVIKGADMMALVHALYRRAADEA